MFNISQKNKTNYRIAFFLILLTIFLSLAIVLPAFAQDDTATVTNRVEELEKEQALIKTDVETLKKNTEELKNQQKEDTEKLDSQIRSLKDDIKEAEGTEIEEISTSSKQLFRRMNKLVDIINFITISFVILLLLALLVILSQSIRSGRQRKKLYELITLLASRPSGQKEVRAEEASQEKVSEDILTTEALQVIESLPNPEIFDKDKLYLSDSQKKHIEEFCLKVDLFESYEIKLFFPSFYLQAIYYFQNGEYEKAVFALNKAIEKEPQNYLGYLGRGISLLRMDILDEALKDLNKVIRNKAELVYAYYVRAVIYTKMNKIKPAIRDLKTAIDKNDFFAGKAADDKDFELIADNNKFKELLEINSNIKEETNMEATEVFKETKDQADNEEDELE